MLALFVDILSTLIHHHWARLTVWDNFQSRDQIGYFNKLVYNCYIMHSEHFLLYFLLTFPPVYMLKTRLSAMTPWCMYVMCVG